MDHYGLWYAPPPKSLAVPWTGVKTSLVMAEVFPGWYMAMWDHSIWDASHVPHANLPQYFFHTLCESQDGFDSLNEQER